MPDWVRRRRANHFLRKKSRTSRIAPPTTTPMMMPFFEILLDEVELRFEEEDVVLGDKRDGLEGVEDNFDRELEKAGNERERVVLNEPEGLAV